MTDFKSVFKQIFNQKKKYIYLVLLVQLFAVVFMTVFMIITNHVIADGTFWTIFIAGRYGKWWELPFGLMISLSIMADIIFAGIMAWQNEKINLSQTWHQIPISDNKLLMANFLSSMVACAYIFLIQIIVTCVCLIPTTIYEKKNIFVEIWNGLGVGTNNFNYLLNELLLITSLAFIVFAFVSFANLSSRTIIEVLPIKSSGWIRMLIIIILVILAAYIYISVDSQIQNYLSFYYNQKHSVYIQEIMPLWITLLEVLGAGIICASLCFILINKYVEPKIVNR